jgi:hypothetical protein
MRYLWLINLDNAAPSPQKAEMEANTERLRGEEHASGTPQSRPAVHDGWAVRQDQRGGGVSFAGTIVWSSRIAMRSPPRPRSTLHGAPAT